MLQSYMRSFEFFYFFGSIFFTKKCTLVLRTNIDVSPSVDVRSPIDYCGMISSFECTANLQIVLARRFARCSRNVVIHLVLYRSDCYLGGQVLPQFSLHLSSAVLGLEFFMVAVNTRPLASSAPRP